VLTAAGARTVSGRDAVIVTVDADGQHLPEDVQRVAGIAAARHDALVLGSRALDDDVPVRSKLGNTVTRYVYSAATGMQVHDTQTGLRAFHRSMIPMLLEIEGDRYEYEINMLLRLAADGVPIIEERIETVYEDNNSGSHFRTVRDSFRVYKEILKFSASSLASFAIDYCMYALLLAVTGASGIANGLIISNIGARIVSGTANYTMNRKFVFKSRAGFARSAAQYILLAAFILAGNTVVLSMLAGTLGLNKLIAKLVTEMIFFIISWIVQRYVIFYKEEGSSDPDLADFHMSPGNGQ
jgi:putative flippase GtrA